MCLFVDYETVKFENSSETLDSQIQSILLGF